MIGDILRMRQLIKNVCQMHSMTTTIVILYIILISNKNDDIYGVRGNKGGALSANMDTSGKTIVAQLWDHSDPKRPDKMTHAFYGERAKKTGEHRLCVSSVGELKKYVRKHVESINT